MYTLISRGKRYCDALKLENPVWKYSYCFCRLQLNGKCYQGISFEKWSHEKISNTSSLNFIEDSFIIDKNANVTIFPSGGERNKAWNQKIAFILYENWLILLLG